MNSELVDIRIESVAKVLIINNLNEVLILTLGEHKLNPARSFTHDLPGGIVDIGETESYAVVRETEEETGIILDQNKIALAYAKTEYIPLIRKSVTKFFYIAHIEKTPNIKLSWEHSSYKWVPVSGLLGYVKLRPFFEEAIEYSIQCGFLDHHN